MVFNNIETLCILKLINPFQAYVPFLYTLKTSENLWFSIFSGEYTKKAFACNGLEKFSKNIFVIVCGHRRNQKFFEFSFVLMKQKRIQANYSYFRCNNVTNVLMFSRGIERNEIKRHEMGYNLSAAFYFIPVDT